MKRNFNVIKNLEVPESWIENAVNIPKTAKKRKKLILNPYLIGTAASLIFVVALSCIMFFSNRQKTNLISYQSELNNTQPTSLSTNVSGTDAHNEQQPTIAFDKEKNTENETIHKSIENNQIMEPSDDIGSHEKTTTQAKVSVEPTEKTQTQTAAPTNPIEVPTIPTEEPWVPIEPLIETISPDETVPTVDPTTTQSVSGELFTGNIIFFPNEQLQQSEQLYCHIVYGGKPMGKVFSQAEIMTINKSDGYRAICNPLKNGIEMHCGQTCDIRIYDRRLRAYYFYNVILSTGDVVLYTQ